MSFTDTLTKNPALMDELIRDIATLIAVAIRANPVRNVPGEDKAFYALILSWAARVDVEAVSDSEKRHTEPECGPEGPDFSL